VKRTRSSRGLVWLSVATVGLTLLSACSSGSKTTASSTPSVASATNKIGGSINVLMVNNPQMLELETLTAKNFTAQTGITVHFVTKVEQDMRDTASTEFANQAGQYDVATLSNFEIPYYAKAGWLAPMTSIANDPTFDQSDILPSMSAALTVNNTVYGEPFYGESSFLMYRKDILTQLGITMPSHPTWAQVAAAADKVTRWHLVRHRLEGAGQHWRLQNSGELLRRPDQEGW
jgi:sorbitol/mannitol transport system substrate-binding protein